MFSLAATLALIATLAVPLPAQATPGRSPNALPTDTVGIATGGGTVALGSIVASFGLNAKRPANFTGGGAATGRINFTKHANVLGGRHVNVPVTFMSIVLTTTPTPNGTGGNAQIVGDCQAQGAECPSNAPGPAFKSVLVYVEDNADSGAGSDFFQITYCTDPATAIPLTCPGGTDGGTLRSGNIQIRANSGGSGGSAPMAPITARRLP
ncbi:MAG TPA: hypothetical protein VEP48_00275 [Methylomirabilota bacterium]|nr:hypothetical protein [Methylomirabilota bacterium]